MLFVEDLMVSFGFKKLSTINKWVYYFLLCSVAAIRTGPRLVAAVWNTRTRNRNPRVAAGVQKKKKSHCVVVGWLYSKIRTTYKYIFPLPVIIWNKFNQRSFFFCSTDVCWKWVFWSVVPGANCSSLYIKLIRRKKMKTSFSKILISVWT